VRASADNRAGERQPSKLKVAGSNPAGVATLRILLNASAYLAPFLSSKVGVLDKLSLANVAFCYARNTIAIACRASRA